jgi:hypothetical protein
VLVGGGWALWAVAQTSHVSVAAHNVIPLSYILPMCLRNRWTPKPFIFGRPTVVTLRTSPTPPAPTNPPRLLLCRPSLLVWPKAANYLTFMASPPFY